MTINKNNYEAFFLDYHEGNLSAEEVADLLLFVELHPELKEAFESFESIAIDDFEANEFKNKAYLKKIVLSANNGSEYVLHEVDYLLISDLEKTSTIKESKQLKQLLENNNALTKEANLYAHTVLKPNIQLVFEDKERLKKKTATLIPFYYSIAIAASIALFVGIFYFNNTNNNKTNHISETNNSSATKQTKTTAVISSPKTLANNPLINNALTNVAVAKKIVRKKSSGKQVPLLASTVTNKTNLTTVNQYLTLKPIDSTIYKLNQIAETTYPETKSEIQTIAKPDEFLSVKEFATQKIKETILEDKELIHKNKTSTKKLSGWDIAQFLTKGISKVAGRKVVELTPHYNTEGDITSYAFKAGKFEMSKAL